MMLTPAEIALLRDPKYLAKFQTPPESPVEAPESAPARRPRPERPRGLKCASKIIIYDGRSDGSTGKRWADCGKCDPCRQWRIERIRRRYELIGYPFEMSVVRVSGLPNPDAAADWRRRIGRLAGVRLSILRPNECIVIFPSNISERDLRHDRRRADLEGLGLSFERRPLLGIELAEMIPMEPMAEGANGKRRAVVWSGWPDFDEESDDFATVQLSVDPVPSIHQEIHDDRSMAVRRIDKIRDVAERQYENCKLRASWGNVHPKALAGILLWDAGLAPWEEWMRPALPLTDVERKAPPEFCRWCSKPSIQGRRLCVECVIRAS